MLIKKTLFGSAILLSLFLSGCQSSSLVPSSSEPSSLEPSSSETPSSEIISSIAPSSEESSSSETISSEPLPQGEPDLFFSEYIEGPGINKVLELYNPTAGPLDLSAYKVVLFSNGRAITATDTQSATLTGTLGAGQTFVIYTLSTTSDPALIDTINAIPADRKFSGSYDNLNDVSNFNGDDAVGLFKNDVLIDVFGVIGHDPGTSWSLTFASGAAITENVVLTRIPSVNAPSVNSINIGGTDYEYAFNPLEWSAVAYTAVPATHTIGTHVIS